MQGGYVVPDLAEAYRGELLFGLPFWVHSVNDPVFWRCLGKMLNWTQLEERDTPEERKMTYGEIIERSWKTKWHNFTDHLIEGKDAESFFNQLLK